MPTRYEYDPDLKILCGVFSGVFSTQALLDEVDRFTAGHENLGGIAIVNVFSRDTEISDITADDLHMLKDEVTARLARHGIERKRTAFIMNGSIELLSLGQMWQNINAVDPETSFPMRFFNTVNEAKDFLGTDVNALRRLIRRIEAME